MRLFRIATLPLVFLAVGLIILGGLMALVLISINGRDDELPEV